jgi:hypothetical protein
VKFIDVIVEAEAAGEERGDGELLAALMMQKKLNLKL